MSAPAEFDAIVIGSGITGGWAAKELTERGLKVLMLERGRMIEHQTDYTTETLAPWELPFRGYGDPKLFDTAYAIQSKGRNFDEWTSSHFVNDLDYPYTTTAEKPFQWRRGYQLGGKSLTWGRQCYRWSDLDFEANAHDGVGVDWPIRYADLSPWYDHVEEFIGVSGSVEGMHQLPDGKFQPVMKLNAAEMLLQQHIGQSYQDRRLIPGRSANLTVEKDGRSPCQYRNICARGCSYGAYFSTQSSTLPAARATGRLTLQTDMAVDSIEYDPKTQRATGVRVINTKTRARATHTARMIFVCAGAYNSVGVLLRSASSAFPNGLANSSGILGQYIMDHASTLSGVSNMPSLDDRYYYGNRPTNFVIPRFRNVNGQKSDFLRGYSFQGGAVRTNWPRGNEAPGLGADLKQKLEKPGEWRMLLVAFAECLPRAENRVTLDTGRMDKDGLPLLNIRLQHGDNEHKLLADAAAEARAMLKLLGGTLLASSDQPGLGGTSVHEMGGARMGRDPKTSVLNGLNQAHDVANLFVTDGAAMGSTAAQNPSLTYMALTARASANAVSMMKQGMI
jgi:choline dehydrogenase-like flavoprotein